MTKKIIENNFLARFLKTHKTASFAKFDNELTKKSCEKTREYANTNYIFYFFKFTKGIH